MDKPACSLRGDMPTMPTEPIHLISVLVGVVLIVAGVGTLATAPWQYYGSATVTVLRILGTVGMMVIGVGIIYVAWGQEWMSTRRESRSYETSLGDD